MRFCGWGNGFRLSKAFFWTKVFPKKFRQNTIVVTDKNLQKVVGELDPNGTGSLLDRFIRLNRDMRRENTQTIYDLRNNTEHKILWSGPFIPVKGARESFFADQRSYVYNGKKIDEQVHLGYDLAQTMNSPVKAANSGKVIYADRLGLFGNCVIIDHGYIVAKPLWAHEQNSREARRSSRQGAADWNQRLNRHGFW